MSEESEPAQPYWAHNVVAAGDWWERPLEHCSSGGHEYLSTACWHATRDGRPELHEYCKADTGLSGSKKPAECKWCRSPCQCGCHDD